MGVWEDGKSEVGRKCWAIEVCCLL